MSTPIDDLIIQYLNFKIEKKLYVKYQRWNLAAVTRDKERNLSKKISNIIEPNVEFLNFSICDKTIDDYCSQIHNCSIYNPERCLKNIQRFKKINDLGL